MLCFAMYLWQILKGFDILDRKLIGAAMPCSPPPPSIPDTLLRPWNSAEKVNIYRIDIHTPSPHTHRHRSIHCDVRSPRSYALSPQPNNTSDVSVPRVMLNNPNVAGAMTYEVQSGACSDQVLTPRRVHTATFM